MYLRRFLNFGSLTTLGMCALFWATVVYALTQVT